MYLSRYLKIGLRWWWLMLLSVALSATASYIYSQQQPRVYAARTSLMVGANITESTNPNEQDISLSRTLAEVYGELALRRPITQAVIDKLGLEMTPEQLASMIQTNVIPGAQLLEIFVLDIHPQRAQILANAIAEELIFQTPGGGGGQIERDKFIQTQLQDLQAKIGNADDKIKQLQDSLSNMTSAVEIAEAQSKLTELEKLKADYQNNYNQFLSNLSASSVNKLAIFEPAIEPTTPVSPNVKTNVLVAAIAGLVLAISAIVALEFFDDTLVWQPEDTQSVLDFPVLGAMSKLTDRASKLVPQNGMWSPEADALRNIRSSLFLAATGKQLQTLLVTSTVMGEGKSFMAANLAAVIASPGSSAAAVIASPGSRVILIDADLRKPMLHEKFDMPNLLGLTDVLAMPDVTVEAMLEKAIRPTGIENLRLLPAGRAVLDPGFLLNSPQFARLLHLLKNKADFIVVDSAPLLAAAETRFIANLVDGTVLIVTDGRTRRRAVQRAINYFRNKDRSNLLGVVFNRVRLSHPYEYYSYRPNSQKFQSSSKQVKSRSTWLGKMWPFNQKSQSPEMATTLLGLNEVADYLGVSKEVAQRWCEQSRIPATKTGRNWMVRLEDLNEFIAVYQHGSNNQDMEPFEIAVPVNTNDPNSRG